MDGQNPYEKTMESNDPVEPEKKVYLAFEVLRAEVTPEDGGQSGEGSTIVIPE